MTRIFQSGISSSLKTALAKLQSGQFAEAEQICRQLLKADRRHPETICLLALTLFRSGETDEAIKWMRKTILIRPDVADYYSELGIMHAETKQFDEAARYQRRAVELQPQNPDHLANAAKTELLRGQLDAAIRDARAALSIRNDHFPAAMTLALALTEAGDSTAASATLRALVARHPAAFPAWNNLAEVLMSSGETEPALQASSTALALNPTLHAGNHLMFLLYSARLTPQQLAAEHFRLAGGISSAAQWHFERYDNQRNAQRKLRIGYVSSDFWQHAVSSFFEPLLIQHDREAFEIFCYSNSSKSDQVTARLKQRADHWIQIDRLDDAQAAKRIHDDRIDLLVELNGHTANNRLLMLSHRPAPIQITYIGYPVTTGLAAIDYRITDALCDPPGTTEALHSEQLIRLDHCFTCFGPPSEAVDVSPLPLTKNKHITFGSFNILQKTNSAVLDLWAQVMRETPGARLLLKNKSLRDASIREKIQENFQRRGISSDRIELVGYTPTFRAHLEMYERIDIALDPFPYNGTTNTCEALWMGVPVITLAGESHVSRVGVSLLTNAGLEELIASDSDAYVAIARALAADEARLTQLRATLRARISSCAITDAPGHARRVEQAYRTAWEKWVSAHA